MATAVRVVEERALAGVTESAPLALDDEGFEAPLFRALLVAREHQDERRADHREREDGRDEPTLAASRADGTRDLPRELVVDLGEESREHVGWWRLHRRE